MGVRDATYVLDGLLYHENDLRIEEHYTDKSWPRVHQTQQSKGTYQYEPTPKDS